MRCSGGHGQGVGRAPDMERGVGVQVAVLGDGLNVAEGVHDVTVAVALRLWGLAVNVRDGVTVEAVTEDKMKAAEVEAKGQGRNGDN